MTLPLSGGVSGGGGLGQFLQDRVSGSELTNVMEEITEKRSFVAINENIEVRELPASYFVEYGHVFDVACGSMLREMRRCGGRISHDGSNLGHSARLDDRWGSKDL